MDDAKKKHGGAGRGQGRKLAGKQKMVVAPIRLEPEQKDKLQRLGGAKWIRRKIDAEPEPDSD